MEGAPTKESVVVAEQGPQVESYAELIAEAQPLFETISNRSESIATMEEYRALEADAAALSTILVQIPSEVRLAHGLPGGYIFSPQEAANDEVYRVAA
jgi:hypothetical protein